MPDSSIYYNKISERSATQEQFISHVRTLYPEVVVESFDENRIKIKRCKSEQKPSLSIAFDGRVIESNNGDSRYNKRLTYSYNDFERVAENYHSRLEMARGLRQWAISGEQVAIFQENTGSGKSAVLAILSHDSPADQRYTFTFATRQNRDDFAARADDDCLVVYGLAEIIESAINEKKRIEKIEQVMNSFYTEMTDEWLDRGYKPATTHMDVVRNAMIDERYGKFESEYSVALLLDRLIEVNLITSAERKAIKAEYDANASKLTKGAHLIMTTAKLEYTATKASNPYENDVVFSDEVYAGMIGRLKNKITMRNIYKTADIVIDSEQYATKKDYEAIDSLKRCYVSAERTFIHELERRKISYRVIGGFYKQYDPGLEVLYVDSTSSAGDEESERAKISRKVREQYGYDATVIANASQLDNNLVNIKGRNDLSSGLNVVVLSYPDPKQLALQAEYAGIDDEGDMKKLINAMMTDTANQAIGRNMGHRNPNGDNHCLLIVPKRAQIELDIVTDKVATVGRWARDNATERTPDDVRDTFTTKTLINSISETVDDQELLADDIAGEIERYRATNPESTFMLIEDIASLNSLSSKAANQTLCESGYFVRRKGKARKNAVVF